MYRIFLSSVVLLLLLTGCSAKGLSIEKIDQFYSDSESVNEMILGVYSDYRSELTDEEQSQFKDYELQYGKDSDFYKSTDDSNIHIISSGISYMKLLITSENDIVTRVDNREEFYSEYTEVKRYIKEAQ